MTGRRFARLAPPLLFALLAAVAATADAAQISVGDYRQRLLGLKGQLDAGDWVGARLAARALLGDRVHVPSTGAGGEEIAPDASLLGPIARATNLLTARGPGGANSRRLAHLIAALSRLNPSGDSPGGTQAAGSRDDAQARLERLRAKEKLADLPGGGALPRPKPPEGALDALGEFFEPLSRALRTLGRKILDWLERLFKAKKPSAGSGAVSNLSIAITLLIALGLAGGVMLYVRRPRAPSDAGGALEAPTPPAADDDPLSREVAEWERYARQLEQAGRTREAVRAWYHAVLVALYRTGFVHYRRGRTNWEYVSSLSPALDVRPGFADLTRRFEREWYGREASAPEALAAAAELAARLLGAVRELDGSRA